MLKDAVDYHDHHGTAKQRKAEKETRRLASAASKTDALQAGEQIRLAPRFLRVSRRAGVPAHLFKAPAELSSPNN